MSKNLEKVVVVIVVICFFGLLGGAIYAATRPEQEYDTAIIVWDDGIIEGWVDGIEDYGDRVVIHMGDMVVSTGWNNVILIYEGEEEEAV